MFIAWQGVGMYTALVYLVLLMLINASTFLHYNVSLLNKINWWLPALITAVFNAWFVPFVKRKRREATPQNYWGRFFSFVGNRDSLFWIPLRYWTAILLVLGLYGLMRFHGHGILMFETFNRGWTG
jgi:hypothetical protein